MRTNVQKPKSVNSTVAISSEENTRLSNFCFRHSLQKKEFIKIALDYFEKNGIDPQIHSEPKTEIEKVLKRIDQLFAFIKVQEKEYLKPAISAITRTEINIQQKINTLVQKSDLQNLPTKSYIDAVQNSLVLKLNSVAIQEGKSLETIRINGIASHNKIMKELEEIKNKRGFSF